MQLTIIGAGSTYTPELVHGFLAGAVAGGSAASPVPPLLAEIALYDCDATRLAAVGGYCHTLAQTARSPMRISLHDSLADSLAGASFVVTQVRVGGNETRAADERAMRELGIVAQETTGAVGFLKAYRTIPVMVDIARTIRKVCPEALLINFTNPAGLVAAAINRAVKPQNVVGLCNVPIFMKKQMLRILRDHLPDLLPMQTEGEDDLLDRLTLDWGGLNHFSWIFGCRLDGVSLMKPLLDLLTDPGFDASPYFPMNKDHIRRNWAIPSPYLRYYTDTETALREQAQNLRADEVLRIEKNLLLRYRQETALVRYAYEKGQTSPVIIPKLSDWGNIELFFTHRGSLVPPLPAELRERGGADYSRLAVRLISDCIRDSSGETGRDPSAGHILNVPDEVGMFGETSGFIEAPVTRRGGRFVPRYPEKTGISDEILRLIKQVRRYEELAVQAGLKQDPALARRALAAHLLVPAGAVEPVLARIASS